MFDHKGMEMFPQHEDIYAVLGFVNCNTAEQILHILSPTLCNNVGDISKLPVLDPAPATRSRITSLVQENIALSKADWDSYETSWDFSTHPLCRPGEPLVERQMRRWQRECAERFERLRSNEEELNAIFARLYGMEGEVETEVPDGKVSVHRVFEAADDVPEGMRGGGYARTFRDEAASLVSYAVGCVMGRYSADAPGLVLADAGATLDDFDEKVPGARFRPCAEGVLTIAETEDVTVDKQNDAVEWIRRWLAATYGEEHLTENVGFLEEQLGYDLRTYLAREAKGGFWYDHRTTYQATSSGKRPIYWMFRSPGKSSRNHPVLRVLVYLHRWDRATAGEVLNEHVRPYARALAAQAEALEAAGGARDVARAASYRQLARELDDWDRDVLHPLAQEHVELDLDAGVQANYKALAARGALAAL